MCSGFDAFVEEQCAKFYADWVGRPSPAPGRYFRMLLGYFEGLPRVLDGSLLPLTPLMHPGVETTGARAVVVAGTAAERRTQ